MKMKVLSPAGDMESLRVAIFHGADEVYLGVKGFNARNIEGFDLSTLKTAIDFAHIYGVRVFLTVNILFNDDELQNALDLIVDAYNLGVDAFILQDIGLSSLVVKYYPQIEIHASTQMGIHNLEGVKVVEKLGFKRVVLSRETPLDEIRRIRENSNIEIEYFVQGALCVSFSGNCYLSSYLYDASGNRGKCKQLCRLPYRLKYEDKVLKYGYLLSAKDFNMIDRLQDLQDAGVTSLKIEGRARRPYYVGVATKMYRNAIDKIKVDKEEIKLGFNRGYAEGYFNGNSGLISYLQNHTGIGIGKVEKFKQGKKFNEIFISTNRNLSEKSSFKFFRKGKEIATISAFDLKKCGEFYRITTKQVVQEGDRVNLIVDNQKEMDVLSFYRKRNLDINIVAIEEQNLYASTIINGEKTELYAEKLEPAKNAPIKKEQIQENFEKTEYFSPNINLKLGNIFIPKSKLNDFRRKFYDLIYSRLTAIKDRNLAKLTIGDQTNNVNELKDYQIITDINEEFKKSNIIFNPEIYDLKTVKSFQNKCIQQKKKAILNLPNFATSQDIETLKDISKKTNIALVVNNLYAIDFEGEKIIGGGMNIFNNVSASFFSLPYLSAENNTFKMPYMTLRHCPMKEHLNADCTNCPYKDGYYYKMDNGTILKLKRHKMSTCTFYLTD